MKTLLTLGAGICLGWLLHLVWVLDESGQENYSYSTPPDQQKEFALPQVDEGFDGEGTQRVASEDSEAQHVISQSNGLKLTERDWDNCIGYGNQYDLCREKLLIFAQSNQSKREIIQELERWLSEYPDDLKVGLLLVDTLVSDRRYLPAIDRLKEIKSYQYDVEAVELMVQKVEALIRSTSRMFHDNNELEGLVSLYQILIDSDTQNPRWRYEVSGVFNKIGHHDRALESLSYILYDAEYGDRATALYQEISRHTRSSGNQDIPLVGNGSQFLVAALINNATSLRLLIDTGASITSINKDILAQVAVNGARPSQGVLQTANGKVTTTIVKLDSLRVGDFVVQNIDTAAIESLGDDLDGLLGMDFLGQFKFAIDQERRVLFLDNRNNR